MRFAPVDQTLGQWKAGNSTLHRESLADRIRAELARVDNHVTPISTTQAEAAARILLPVLELRGEVIHPRRKRLYAV